MVKKSLAILLSAVMLLALCPATMVLGAMPATGLTVVDEAVTAGTTGVAVDNFDNLEAGTTVDDYPRNMTSDVFRFESRQYSPMTIVSAEDSENTSDNVLLMKRGASGNGALYSKKFTVTEGFVNEITYDFRFKALPTAETIGSTTTTKFLGYAGGGCIDLTYDADAGKWKMWSAGQGVGNGVVYPSLDTWYTARATIDGTGLLKTYMIDKATGSLLLTANRQSAGGGLLTDEKSFQIAAVPRLIATANDSFQVEFNNVKMAVYNQTENTPAVSKSSIDEKINSVPIDTATIEITFDQDITAKPDTVNITSEGEQAITAPATAVSGKLNTYILTLDGALSGLKEYTIDLSGFTNSAGASADNFSFTTAAPAPVIASSIPEDGATDISAELKTMSITFDQVMAEYPASLELADGVNATVSTEDNITFTLSWTADLDGDTTYRVSLEEFKNAEGKAPSKEAISFTTEFTGIVTETDDFEQESWKTNWDARYDSGVLYHSNGGTWTGTHFSHVTGYGEGNALCISDGSEIFTALKTIRTKNTYTLEDGEVLVATWRINLKKMATVDEENNKVGSDIYIGGAISSENANYTNGSYAVGRIKTMNGRPYIYHEYDGLTNYAYLEENHWYNVYNVIEGEAQTLYLVDAEGENKGSLVWKRSKKGETTLPNLMQTAAYVCVTDAGRRKDISGNIYNDSQSFLLDDFTLYTINTNSRHHALKAAVAENDGTYSMTFNQPVIGNENAFKVAEVVNSEYNYDTDAKAQVLYPDFCTQNVSLTDTAYKTTYVLDYSSVKGAAGTSLASGVSGITASVTTGLDTVRTLTLAGNASCENSLISFKLYNDADTAETAKIYVALYKNNAFLGAVMPDDVVTVNSKSESTVTVSTDNYSDFDTIKVFAVSSDYVPLMGVYNKIIK